MASRKKKEEGDDTPRPLPHTHGWAGNWSGRTSLAIKPAFLGP